jgi:hypothetical protein
VLQHRVVSKGLCSVVQVFVQWSSILAKLLTWEDMESLKQRFPRAPAWGQAAAFGGGNVSTAEVGNSNSRMQVGASQMG